MSGRPRGTHARTEILQVRLTPSGMQTLDLMRGTSNRSDYIRRLIHEEWNRTHRGGR